MKLLRHEEQARLSFLRGVDRLADVMELTLGPLGRTVLMEQRGGQAPLVTRSGREVSRFLEVADPFENLGARAARDAAAMVFAATGDGSTTTVVMTRRMMHEAFAALRAGASPAALRAEMIEATVGAVGSLCAAARACEGPHLQRGIVRSAAHDDAVAVALLEAVARAPLGGRVYLEEGRGSEDELVGLTAHEFGRGLNSTGFPPPEGADTLVLEAPLVFVCGAPLVSAEDVRPVLELALEAGRALLVIAPQVGAEARKTLVANHLAGRVPCAGLTTPLSSDEGHAVLSDLAALTGATLLPAPRLLRGAADLGGAGRAELGRERTLFSDARGDPQRLEDLRQGLRHALDHSSAATRSPSGLLHLREQLEARWRMLAGPCATLRLGGHSQAAQRDRLGRAESASAALAAALEEGVVEGGGAALLRAAQTLTTGSAGARVIAAALCSPFRLLVRSAAADPGLVTAAVLGQASPAGFDLLSGRVVDLFEAGIVDPVRVLRLAVQTATGITMTVMDAGLMMVERRGTPVGARPFDPRVAAATREDSWSPPIPTAHEVSPPFR